MTVEQIAHLEDSIGLSIHMLQRDPDWVDAFKEYNDDIKKYKKLKKTKPFLGGQPLHLNCAPCYAIVLRYLKTKQK